MTSKDEIRTGWCLNLTDQSGGLEYLEYKEPLVISLKGGTSAFGMASNPASKSIWIHKYDVIGSIISM
jgi:hypothetical protein